MAAAAGFAYEVVGDTVLTTHHGRRATVLRGQHASAFVAEVVDDDPQELMARLTGSDKRHARDHPRNRGR